MTRSGTAEMVDGTSQRRQSGAGRRGSQGGRGGCRDGGATPWRAPEPLSLDAARQPRSWKGPLQRRRRRAVACASRNCLRRRLAQAPSTLQAPHASRRTRAPPLSAGPSGGGGAPPPPGRAGGPTGAPPEAMRARPQATAASGSPTWEMRPPLLPFRSSRYKCNFQFFYIENEKMVS